MRVKGNRKHCLFVREPHLLKRAVSASLLVLVGLIAFIGSVQAAHGDGKQIPVIGLIIDDLGNQLEAALETLKLPGPVACAILPHTPYAKMIAEKAHRQGKEVMLHLPMQSLNNRPLGLGGLGVDMTRAEIVKTVRENLNSIPHVVGINNHMGSLLTQQPQQMAWLMRELQKRGDLFFVDSRTTKRTIAKMMAHVFDVPVRKRDLFLDNERNPAAIRFQFQKLLSMARKNGSALGIGHPYPETLQVLRELFMQQDKEEKFRLVSIRYMTQMTKRPSHLH